MRTCAQCIGGLHVELQGPMGGTPDRCKNYSVCRVSLSVSLFLLRGAFEREV
jgi:hypothetical protein